MVHERHAQPLEEAVEPFVGSMFSELPTNLQARLAMVRPAWDKAAKDADVRETRLNLARIAAQNEFPPGRRLGLQEDWLPANYDPGLGGAIDASQAEAASDEAQFELHFDRAARLRIRKLEGKKVLLEAEHSELKALPPKTVTEKRIKREELEHIEARLRALDEGQETANAEAPAAAEPAPVAAAVLPDATPRPLTTGDMAFCFDGLRYTEAQWKKPLGNMPKWLESCLVEHGHRGVIERQWNPVLIGAALVHAGHVQARFVRARFQSRPMLTPWLDAWKTYEADYIEGA